VKGGADERRPRVGKGGRKAGGGGVAEIRVSFRSFRSFCVFSSFCWRGRGAAVKGVGLRCLYAHRSGKMETILILNIELVELTLDRLPKGLWLPRGVVGHRDIVSEYLYIFILAFQTHTSLIGNKLYERL